MSLDQGPDAAASFVPPQRTPVEFDPESNGLRIGPYERRIADPSDPDQVFGAYISLLYVVRGAQPGEQLKLRSADLEALLLIVGDDPETIEKRLIALMGCTAQEARVLGNALLRHRRLTATLGIAGALALGGSVAGDDFFEGSASDAPRAAVVQSVADGLRALDDAGYPYASAPSAVSPASVTMPTDDWTGSKPVGGSPDVPAGAPVAGGGAPAGQAPSAGGVPAGTPAAPAAGSGDADRGAALRRQGHRPYARRGHPEEAAGQRPRRGCPYRPRRNGLIDRVVIDPLRVLNAVRPGVAHVSDRRTGPRHVLAHSSSRTGLRRCQGSRSDRPSMRVTI